MIIFLNPTLEVVTFRFRGWWCILGVFVVGIHPFRTWISGSFECVRWNACVHRLDLGLYSNPKEAFLSGGGGGVGGQKSQNPCQLPETQRRIEPATLHRAGQRAQYTTD